MNDPLRILWVEDSELDMELEVVALRSGGLAFTARRVETEGELRKELSAFAPHLVISDYALPALDGLRILHVVRELSTDLPFIFVSGTIGQERAIESLKNGATDYVEKDQLGGLTVKVRRALEEARAREEHRKLESQLLQLQRIEALGRLAGGVAHDFNNLLTVINGFSELILGRLKPEDPIAADVEEIRKAGLRGATLTRQLLTFSRKQSIQPAPLDLNTVVGDVQKMLSRLVGEDVSIGVSLAPGLGRVRMDPGQLEQVLVNLVVNARDAMPKGGRIRVSTSGLELDDAYARTHVQARPGPHAVLSVADSGTGIPDAVLPHIFEPFFTTKAFGKGTGLGLSTVHGIVQQAGGSIEVQTSAGEGTTFRVLLPLDLSLPAASPAADATPPPVRGDATVLVAEDQDSVRKLTAAILERQGYTVLQAKDGTEALRIVEEHGAPIDLLVTDMVMRAMSGLELSTMVRRLHPETRLLLMSGYVERMPELPADAQFLQKPFTIDVLCDKVKEALALRSGA
jgi:two-component system, cell cycle sensor histidine kinase and response regulator CckA